MSALQIESARSFKREKRGEKKNLMKHSVGRSQGWENNRQITRGGGREGGERREDRRGEEEGGGRRQGGGGGAEPQLNVS